MWPFRRGFDPSRQHRYSAVPTRFASPAMYLDTMEKNCEAELSASVRDNRRPAILHGTLVSREDSSGAGAWVEIHDASTEESLSKRLLRSPAETFHIIRRSNAPDSDDPNGKHQILLEHLPLQFDVGDKLSFRDYGFIGDSMAQVEAIRELKATMDDFPLLLVAADPRTQEDGDGQLIRGQYATVTADRARGNPWNANAEQLAALLDWFEAAVRLIQGPPGCGKTKMISYVRQYAASKNITTIVVDEASRLCEMDVPRLLVAARGTLKNMIFVGDQQQLQPFTSSQSPAAKSSLMQRLHYR